MLSRCSSSTFHTDKVITVLVDGSSHGAQATGNTGVNHGHPRFLHQAYLKSTAGLIQLQRFCSQSFYSSSFPSGVDEARYTSAGVCTIKIPMMLVGPQNLGC
ncbi:hypothetical protein ACP70R_049201 [Stipagrostis hirtigluma subsp. patula]